MILYFTGTGNSRYLADVMGQQLQDTVTDASKLIKAGKRPDFISDKPYIIVAPVYAWRLPRVFAAWLRECTYAGSRQIYFVLNCGSEIGAAGKYAKRLASDMGLAYMGTAEVVMPENYLVMFTPPPQEKDDAVITAATEQIAKLAEQVAAGEPFLAKSTTLIGYLSSGIVNSCFYTFTVRTKKFYAADACISCGKCVKSCMLNNIILQDGKPVWGKDCTHCMACICRCPAEAIEYGKRTKGLRRYICPKE